MIATLRRRLIRVPARVAERPGHGGCPVRAALGRTAWA